MPIFLRTGSMGNYYGSTLNSSEPLENDTQLHTNAKYIYHYLLLKGWTKNAVAGMLGNMQAESGLNPGRWQYDEVADHFNDGYGLVQWTPSLNYFEWCWERGYEDPSEMDINLARIQWEMGVGQQWIATTDYPFSFQEFAISTQSPEYLASAFLKNYERAGVEVEELRRTYARYWYDNLDSDIPEPEDPSISSKKKGSYKFVLFNRRKKVH